MGAPRRPDAAQPRVFVVDDDALMLKVVQGSLGRAGFQVTAFSSPVAALAAASELEPDVVLVDLHMPEMTGLQLLQELKSRRAEVEVIVVTGFGSVKTAVEAVKAGAYQYLTKPFEHIDDLILTVQKAAERRQLIKRTRMLETLLERSDGLEGIIGQSASLQSVFKQVRSVAASSATVLIQGESGTGKELVARAIHRLSPRRDRPFVALNCSALPESLLESELFGHVKGAFTGAVSGQKGIFEAAHGGTVFLDEIGDISPATQVRLLRVLQEGEIKRVGAHETVRVDTRVIAATHVDLAKAIKAGKFRSDLYYRLNVVSIPLPPLRERLDDVPLLAQHFLRKYATKMGRQVSELAPDALAALASYAWPGNVRELENAIERAVVFAQGDTVRLEDLPPGFAAPRIGAQAAPGPISTDALAHLPYAQAKQLAIQAFEQGYLNAVLSEAGGNITRAAKAAGLDRSNFRRLLKQYNVSAQSAEADD